MQEEHRKQGIPRYFVPETVHHQITFYDIASWYFALLELSMIYIYSRIIELVDNSSISIENYEEMKI